MCLWAAAFNSKEHLPLLVTGTGWGLGLFLSLGTEQKRRGFVLCSNVGVQQGTAMFGLGSEAQQIARQEKKLEEKEASSNAS